MDTPIHFFVSCALDAGLIEHRIGFPEYSYFFVLEDFIPLLERIGKVTRLADPKNELARHVQSAHEAGERPLFLNFTAPHNLIEPVACPTAHVFAWEFNTIPTDSWAQDGLQDWRLALRAHKCAITHSTYARDAITAAMGEDFPVAVAPCPVWDRYDDERRAINDRTPIKSTTLFFEGRVFDTRQIEFFVEYDVDRLKREREEADLLQSSVSDAYQRGQDASLNGTTDEANSAKRSLKDLMRDLAPPILWRALSALRTNHNSAGEADVSDGTDGAGSSDHKPSATSDAQIDSSPQRLNAAHLEGVVYTSIFNPLDGRKNWRDMVSAFIWAHKKNADATLIIKAPNLDEADFIVPLTDFMKRFLPFDCRVLVLKGFLDNEKYRTLLDATSFYVNTSFGEGQCLPLMEYLSAGVPAIAPATTALGDYMTPEMSFVVEAHAEPSAWQHDPRLSYRALRYRVDWLGLVEAFEKSYNLAKSDVEGWRALGRAAAQRLEGHASLAVAEKRMRAFLSEVA
ncbi:MAG: glycosyltransferase [Pseudomonadota bacterium]